MKQPFRKKKLSHGFGEWCLVHFIHQPDLNVKNGYGQESVTTEKNVGGGGWLPPQGEYTSNKSSFINEVLI